MVITMITMAIGQKTGSGEGFCHGDYHGNGQNTVLKVGGFCLGDYLSSKTENYERGKFLPW